MSRFLRLWSVINFWTVLNWGDGLVQHFHLLLSVSALRTQNMKYLVPKYVIRIWLELFKMYVRDFSLTSGAIQPLARCFKEVFSIQHKQNLAKWRLKKEEEEEGWTPQITVILFTVTLVSAGTNPAISLCGPVPMGVTERSRSHPVHCMFSTEVCNLERPRYFH